jgi:hypothetical protein
VHFTHGSDPLSNRAAEEETPFTSGTRYPDAWVQDHLADLFSVFVCERLGHRAASVRELDAPLGIIASLLTASAVLLHRVGRTAALISPPLLPRPTLESRAVVF